MKKNLIFIFTDEQSADTMKAYGNNFIRTPNMEKLAMDGAVFKNTYVTQPVCSPSRSTLMTGLYPHNSGCTENNKALCKDVKCIPELIDYEVYKTAYLGKWHLGDEVFAQHGFETWVSIEDFYSAYYSDDKDPFAHSSYTDYLLSNEFAPDIKKENGFITFSREFTSRLSKEHSKPKYLAREACKFIDKNKNNPFILVVNFFEPHMPFTSCNDDMYDPDEIPLPDTFEMDILPNQQPKLKLFRKQYEKCGDESIPLKTAEDWKRVRANYYGMVSLVDEALGDIIEKLKSEGLYDDAVIVYTSDHGDMMGSRKLVGKCNMFEEAVKVPFLLKAPEIKPCILEHNVSQVDIVPTLLDFLGCTDHAELDGYSLKNYILHNEKPMQQDVFITWHGYNSGFGDIVGSDMGFKLWENEYSEEDLKKILGDLVRTVVTPDMLKYTWSKYFSDELYDLKTDPHEINNLAGNKEYHEVIQELKSRIEQWKRRVGESCI
jgi:arylsulfatase A-like enzyme